MNAREINRHFLANAPWCDPQKTVDRVIIGDENKEISRILVTWMSDLNALRYAAAHGFDMVMTHEPTFYSHANEREEIARSLSPMAQKIARDKEAYLLQTGIVVLRNHDVWDKMPKIGIPFALAAELLGQDSPACASANGFLHRYTVPQTTAGAFLKTVQNFCAQYEDPSAVLFGDPKRRVCSIGIGTGCGCDPMEFMQLGCDIALACDDGAIYWENISVALDADFPVIRINHATSEEPGMKSLCAYIRETLHIDAQYFMHRKAMTI